MNPNIKDITINKFTTDADLVELAGKHAYVPNLEPGNDIVVNGTPYKIAETNFNSKNGLDVLIVQNTKNSEYSMVFVGSVGSDDWVGTNPKLLSDKMPPQMEEGIRYFEEMRKTYDITSLSGNSLGGSLANAIATKYPDVRTVTLNPALLPEGMVDKNKEYDNITNYYSDYDVLTPTVESLKYGYRIPGTKYKIGNGVPLFGEMDVNHTGYSEGGLGYEVGTKGQPGHGFIINDADEFIVTSIWTGASLHGGNSERIEINKTNMMLLATGMKTRVKERVQLFHTYLGNSIDIIDDENRKFKERVNKLQDTFSSMIEDAAGEPIFKGVAWTGTLIKGSIDVLLDLLDMVEAKCKILNSILNSAPMEVVENIFSVDFSVESILASVREVLNGMKANIDELVKMLHDMVYETIPTLFEGGKDQFVDAVVHEMDAHYDIVNFNREAVLNHVDEFSLQINDVAVAFDDRDLRLASAIQGFSPTEGEVNDVQATNNYILTESPYMIEGMKTKELHADRAHQLIVNIAHYKLKPLLLIINTAIRMLEIHLENMIFALKNIKNIILKGNPTLFVLGLFTDYDQRIKDSVNAIIAKVEEMENTIEGLRKGITQLHNNIPDLLNSFKPYIVVALFENGKYKNVYRYNTASLAILNEMKILFDDIIFQLSDHTANSIDTLCEVSKKLLDNMNILKEQVERTTIL